MNTDKLLLDAVNLGYNTSKHQEAEIYLLSGIQKWLREVHKIYIDTIYNAFTGEHSIVIKTTFENTVKTKVINEFMDYESALKAGLQYALKLIS